MERRGALPILALAALVLLAACETGDHAFVRQAKEECAARGLDPAGDAYAGCVERRADEIAAYWMRALKTSGE